jgi:hypothetical protein
MDGSRAVIDRRTGSVGFKVSQSNENWRLASHLNESWLHEPDLLCCSVFLGCGEEGHSHRRLQARPRVSINKLYFSKAAAQRSLLQEINFKNLSLSKSAAVDRPPGHIEKNRRVNNWNVSPCFRPHGNSLAGFFFIFDKSSAKPCLSSFARLMSNSTGFTQVETFFAASKNTV